MADLAWRFKTAFLAIATTYSTSGWASRNSSNCGFAKPASSRTRIRAFRKRWRKQRQSSPQNPQRSLRRRGLAGSQDRREQVLLRLVIEGDKSHHGQIAPGVVIAVEQSQLLGSVGRIVGGIQVDRDALRAAMQALGMPLDHAFR